MPKMAYIERYRQSLKTRNTYSKTELDWKNARSVLFITITLLVPFIIVGKLFSLLDSFYYLSMMISTVIIGTFTIILSSHERRIQSDSDIPYSIKPILIIDTISMIGIWMTIEGFILFVFYRQVVSDFFILFYIIPGIIASGIHRYTMRKIYDTVGGWKENYYLRLLLFMGFAVTILCYILPTLVPQTHFVIVHVLLVILTISRIIINQFYNVDTYQFPTSVEMLVLSVFFILFGTSIFVTRNPKVENPPFITTSPLVQETLFKKDYYRFYSYHNGDIIAIESETSTEFFNQEGTLLEEKSNVTVGLYDDQLFYYERVIREDQLVFEFYRFDSAGAPEYIGWTINTPYLNILFTYNDQLYAIDSEYENHETTFLQRFTIDETTKEMISFDYYGAFDSDQTTIYYQSKEFVIFHQGDTFYYYNENEDFSRDTDRIFYSDGYILKSFRDGKYYLYTLEDYINDSNPTLLQTDIYDIDQFHVQGDSFFIQGIDSLYQNSYVYQVDFNGNKLSEFILYQHQFDVTDHINYSYTFSADYPVILFEDTIWMYNTESNALQTIDYTALNVIRFTPTQSMGLGTSLFLFLGYLLFRCSEKSVFNGEGIK